MKAKKILKTVLIVFLVSVLFIIISGITAFFVITSDTNLDKNAIMPKVSKLTMCDLNGEEIIYSSKINNYVAYDDINKNIINAFIALEDKRFYKHSGIDYYRICGAVVNNIKSGSFVEGASTITQQLAKNALLSNEKTITRKLKEAKLAYQIEKNFSKEEILTMYFNAIYFGNGIYGLDAATKRLFNKSPKDVSLPEAAILAGLVKNPRDNSPLNNKENAAFRMKLVLKLMKEQNYIDMSQYETAMNYTYEDAPQPQSVNYRYSNSVLREASQLLHISEKELLTKNYKIITYYDKVAQSNIERLIKGGSFTPPEGGDCLAMLADNKSGGIIAYYSTFNNAIQDIRRQPASTIKPLFSYAPALNIGYITPSTPVLDKEVDISGYKPQNYGYVYNGWINIRESILKSSNVVAVRLANEIGIDYCKEIATKMGLKFSPNDKLATALGGMYEGVTFSELIDGYMTLANGGQNQESRFISKILDGDGGAIYTRKPYLTRAISPESAYLMTDMLMDTAQYGTAKKLHDIGFQVASKTGTAGNENGNTDALNMSYTSNNTLAVWYGSINNKIMLKSQTTGGSYPTLLARYILKELGKPVDFFVPDNIIEAEIDTYSTNKDNILYLASENTPTIYRQLEKFDKNNFNLPFSPYFDEMYKNFVLELKGNDVEISFDTKTSLRYKLYKVKNGENKLLVDIEGDGNNFKFTDKLVGFGLNRYFYTIESADNQIIFTSEEKTIFSFF